MNDISAPLTENRSIRSTRVFNHLHRFKNQLRRRWWIVPLLAFLALGIQGYRLYTAPPAYISVGKMIVNIKIQTQTGTGTTYTEEMGNFLATQVALMRSGTVLQRAAARVHSLRPDLKVAKVELPPQFSVIPKTTMFNMPLVGEDPEYTTAFLQACMEEYTNLKKEIRGTASESTLAGVMAELSRLEKDLQAGETELLDFQSSNSVVFLQEQGNSAGAYLARLTRQLADLQSELQLLRSLSLEQNLERQKNKLALPAIAGDTTSAADDSVTTLIGADADYLKLRQQIQMLKAEQAQLAEYLRPKHPKMIDLQDKLDQKEKLLDIFKQQSKEQLANRQNSIEIQVDSLKKEISIWEAKSLDASRKMAEYQKIKAGNTRVQGLYDRLQQTMQTLSSDKDISPESVTILERASAAVPANDNTVVSLLMAAALGLGAAFGMLVLFDRFDDRVTSFTDVQDIFDEEVLCQVPREISLNEGGKLELIHANDDRHAFAEAYRNLRSSMLYMGPDRKTPKLLAVTSTVPSEGKSVTVANLAVTFAESGARVLVVDADLRKGTVHEHFGKEASPGLTEVLARELDWKSAVHVTKIPGLSVITRGRTARNPSELFFGPVAKGLFTEMSDAYDMVILDTAPVMAADDVTTLAPQTDGVVFVLRANFTSARIARAALDLLYQRHVNVFGLALNAVTADASEYYYYKYKGYYYADDGHKKRKKV